MSRSLTAIIVLLTLIHIAAFIVMLWIRFRRSEADHTAAESGAPRTCVVCREPAPYLFYDGLDPNEQHDSATGRPYSTEVTHYQPRCATHAQANLGTSSG
ncbi:MAG TPA: hypothetical protein VGH27_14010 [Streptosporangiaceae bacterium]